jgi:hypothetical protein
MEALCVGSIALLAVTAYVPGARGAVSVTEPPLELEVALKEPPVGLTLHVTPVESLVVAVSSSRWPTVRPARRGEMEMEIVPALMVRGNVAATLCAVALESVT